jgi:ATP-binding cassette subfamily B protein
MEKKRVYTKETFRIYAREALKYPWLFAVVIVGMIALQATTLTAPLLLKDFFNILAASMPNAANADRLLYVVMLIGLVAVANWTAIRIHFAALVYLDGRVMRDLYERGFDYLLRHSYHFFTNQFAGTLTRRVGRFSKSFETIFDSIIIQFVPSAIFIVGAIVILGLRNITLGAALAAWVLVFLTVQILFMRWQLPLRVKRAEEDSRMTGALADAIGNQNTIAVFSGTAFELKRFRGIADVWYRAVIRNWNAGEVVWGVLGLLMVGINVGLLYGAVYFWQRGQLTIGDFVLIQAYLLTTFDRLAAINRELRQFNEAFADAGEMVEILETPHEIRDVPGTKALRVEQGAIDFKNVNFYFSDSHPILPDFTLSVAGGEKIALVGPSGAGKTTVTKLLLRLYNVKGGSVSIDGQNIAQVTQDSVRDAVAFVPQEPVLFHRTLMENIRYGRREATDAEVKEAAKQAHCEEFIAKTSHGYETFVGERGIKLSGGERQRIAIARAILKDAPILVLDEATSSLDSESESLIQDALEKLMKGKTVIAIAHRLSTVMKMDRIVVIEKGNVATTGTHAELLTHEGGLYKKLWEIQAGGFITDDTEAP